MKTKRLVTLAVTLLITLATMAQQAVTMTGFEQSRSGLSSNVTLCNNTQQEIHKVSFRIIYYNTQGTQIDYKDYTENVNIDIGMSKAVEIEPFGVYGNYVYFDQKNKWDKDNIIFKVGFQLKSVNGVPTNDQTVQQLKPASENEEAETDKEESSEAPLIPTLTMGMVMMIGIILLALSSGWLVAVYLMARLYGQNPWLWVLVSFVLSPILAFLLILIFGHKNPRYEQEQTGNTSDHWEH